MKPAMKKAAVPRVCYTATELAALIGCGKNKLMPMVERGELPRPFTGMKNGKRRWSALAVHKALGMPPSVEIKATER